MSENNYIYKIFAYQDNDFPDTKHYFYRIYKDGNFLLESDANAFMAEQEAKYAAAGQIVYLKKGEEECS